MNYIYRRFDTQDSSSRCDSVLSDVFVSNADRLEIDADVVTKAFQHVCSRKATGPDGISAFLLKHLLRSWHRFGAPYSNFRSITTGYKYSGKPHILLLYQRKLAQKKTMITDLLHLHQLS